MHETNLIPGNDVHTLYYSFRIPHNRLVFEKESNRFAASFEILTEISDSSDYVLQRYIESKEITTTLFEETNSSEIYTEGVLKFTVPSGNLKFLTILTDKKSGQELRMPQKELSVKPLQEYMFLSPIIVNNIKVTCKDTPQYRLANYEGNIPLSEEPFDILIQTGIDNIDKIYIDILREDTVIWNGEVENKIKGQINIEECNGINLFINDDSSASVFRISGISGLLDEGEYSLNVSDIKNSKTPEKFQLVVKWYNRPFSLADPEYAIESLDNIISDDIVSGLLKNKRADYRRVLNNYWKDLDPTPATRFNPLMKEYYTRIDYAVKNFGSISKKNGANTDRGKIFIKYGNPSDVERSYNVNGNIVETWRYEKIKFIFVDEKGTGEFLLING